MWHSDFASLVAALLSIRYLVFDLDTASACFDHFLGQQVGCFVVTKASIDVGNDWHNVRFEVVNCFFDCFNFSAVASILSFLQIAEHVVQFFSVGLTQEGVQLFDQRRNRCFFVH